jgi:FkbH-like protein
MKEFSQLRKNLKKDFSDLNLVKVAVLGDTATQLLVQSIRGMGYEYGLNLNIWEAEFDQIQHQVQDQNSDFYVFRPDVVIIFQSSHKLLKKYNQLDGQGREQLATNQIDSIRSIMDLVSGHLGAKVIAFNYNEIDDAVFGSYSNKTSSSFLFQLRKLNYELMLLASENPSLFICDISTIQNRIGKLNFFQPSIYVNTEMVLSIEALPHISARTVDIIAAQTGMFNKCIILDLDNTTWGGIIGDDGIENIQVGSLGIGKAFTEFQYWVKKLKERGIIVAVCSKNTESVAREPFEKHPEMVLRMEDISVFMANWENKADNIRHIQSVLNIGFDSMVFIDDNAFERNIVRDNIPDIQVPEMPEDPAEYLEYLYSLNLFETVSFSGEDLKRTQQYQIEAKRSAVLAKFTDIDDYLESLEMMSEVKFFDKFNTPRIAQLSQRSNQFNLRTVRYTEDDIHGIKDSDIRFGLSFTLGDKFGNHGLICVIILDIESKDTLFIDTWFMSCRVLKRGMEGFVLNCIVDFADKNGYKSVMGEYIPTPKNEMVRNHFSDLGFVESEGKWILKVADYNRHKNFIKEE